MNILKPALTSLSVTALIIMMLTSYVYASDDDKDDQKSRSWKISGTAVTGPNDRCGERLWILPPPFDSPDMHFTIIGAYNSDPKATNSIPLNSELCAKPDTLLATYSNPILNELGGFLEPDSRLTNLPLRQVPQKAFPDGTKVTLLKQSVSMGNPFPPTLNEPNFPITTGMWLEGGGELKIKCKKNGTAKINGKFWGLVPNGIYGMYATWLTALPGSDSLTFIPIAFGGVPSLIAPDEDGNARISRSLSYCPMDDAPDGSLIMFVNVGLHLDAAPTGVFPQIVNIPETFIDAEGNIFESVTPPGIVTIPHVQFPINVSFL